MIDFPTNPAAGDLVPRRLQTQMIKVLTSRLQEASIRCARYTLVKRSESSGTATRTSSTPATASRFDTVC